MHKEENQKKEKENQQSANENSEQKESTEQTSLSQTNAEEEAQKVIDRAKLMSTIMIDGAMRYREAYWREDIETEVKAINKLNRELFKGKSHGHEKAIAQNLQRLMEYKRSQENINKSLNGLLDKVNRTLSDDNGMKFDNYVVGVSMVIEEFLTAKNTTEMITLMKLYNQGLLDGVFSKHKALKEEEEKEEENV